MDVTVESPRPAQPHFEHDLSQRQTSFTCSPPYSDKSLLFFDIKVKLESFSLCCVSNLKLVFFFVVLVLYVGHGTLKNESCRLMIISTIQGWSPKCLLTSLSSQTIIRVLRVT